MERLTLIHDVQNQVLYRFGTPREAYRALICGRVTKIKFIVSLYYELAISPYAAAQFMWLFEDMDEVTEDVWVESFGRISGMWSRTNVGISTRRALDNMNAKTAMPDFSFDDLLSTPAYKTRMRGYMTPGKESL